LSKHGAKKQEVKYIEEINKKIVRSHTQTHLDSSTMAPPKVGAPSQMPRRSYMNKKSSLETIVATEIPTQTEGVVDVDAIPSPDLTIPTLVKD
jgi:hypothetical protein